MNLRPSRGKGYGGAWLLDGDGKAPEADWLGIWLGLRLTRRPETVVERTAVVPGGPAFVRNDAEAAALGLTPRELEMLELVAGGLSNREIAAEAFVSENEDHPFG